MRNEMIERTDGFEDKMNLDVWQINADNSQNDKQNWEGEKVTVIYHIGEILTDGWR